MHTINADKLRKRIELCVCPHKKCLKGKISWLMVQRKRAKTPRTARGVEKISARSAPLEPLDAG